MTNPIHPTITITLEGQPRALRMEHRDWCEAEGVLNRPLLGPPAKEFWESPAKGYQLGILLFVGLLHAWPGLTLDQARSLITFQNSGYVEETITAAMRAYFGLPEGDEAEVDENPSQEGETNGGSPSGPAPAMIFGSPSGSSGDSPREPLPRYSRD